MNEFLETHILAKLRQEEKENLIRQITRVEIESVIKKKNNNNK